MRRIHEKRIKAYESQKKTGLKLKAIGGYHVSAKTIKHKET